MVVKWPSVLRRIGAWFERLPLRLLLFVAVPLLASQAGVAIGVQQLLERRVERRMQEDVELVARALQRPVDEALSRGEVGQILSILRTSFDFRRVYGASVYDQRGNVVAASGGTDWHSRLPATQLPRQGGGQYETVGDEAVYSYYVPVWLDAGGRRGMLRITRKKSEIDAFLRAMRMQTIGIVLFGAILTTAIVFGGHYVAVGRAFGRFRASIVRIRQGDREHRAPVTGPREVRNITEAFNGMMDSIEEAQSRLFQERERKAQLAARLIHAEKMASIGRIAGGIAHELGSPLGTFSGRLQRVLRNERLPQPARAELDAVEREVGRMTRIVSEVMDFARADESKRRPVDLCHMVCSVASGARVDQEQGQPGREIHVDCPRDHLWIDAEPSRLERAISNLVRNALDAVPDTGTVTIRVHGPLKSAVIVSVEDDGPGIAPEIRDSLFEPFVTTKPGRGTGLGLPIAEAIVRQHGGELDVEEREGGGTRFWFELPLLDEQSPTRNQAKGESN